MKRFLRPLTILLPLIAVATAGAQIVPVRFVAPVNPIAGLPRLLPSPMTGPLVGLGITLPSLVPALTPAMSLPSAPTPAFILPVSLPSRQGVIPATPASSSRGDVVNPLRRVMPGVVIRFSAAATNAAANAPKPGAAQSDPSKEKFDQAFDGEDAPKPAVQLPGRKPVTSGRHISLPEWDLERELGI
jgi:hypothetical protein